MAPSAGSWLSWWRLPAKKSTATLGCGTAETVTPLWPTLAEAGMFAAFRQRPFDVLANPADTPRAIYVSGFDSSPMAASTSVVVEGQMDHLQRGIDALAELAGAGGVHVGLQAGDSALAGLKNCKTTAFQGPHPAGNVGVQIHHTAPINKGEVLWTLGLQDAINLGALLNTGKYSARRVVAACGSEMETPVTWKPSLAPSSPTSD